MDKIAAAKAALIDIEPSGLRHKRSEWSAESPIRLMFGGSVWFSFIT
jgi:hypothetical protein